MHPKTMIIIGIMVAFINVVCWNSAYSATTFKSSMPSPKGEITLIEADVPKPTPVYNPEGKIDPFQPCIQENTVAQATKETINVPDTPLTRWTLGQLELKGTVMMKKGAIAIFKTPKEGPAYTGRVGDFVGRMGIVIVVIQNGQIRLSNGDHMKTNK
jgi:Tfp pilus assembly protein PilP